MTYKSKLTLLPVNRSDSFSRKEAAEENIYIREKEMEK